MSIKPASSSRESDSDAFSIDQPCWAPSSLNSLKEDEVGMACVQFVQASEEDGIGEHVIERMFTLEKKRLRGILSIYINTCTKKMEPSSFQWQEKRQWANTQTQVPFEHQKTFLLEA